MNAAIAFILVFRLVIGDKKQVTDNREKLDVYGSQRTVSAIYHKTLKDCRSRSKEESLSSLYLRD
jgi:hypothetical protein